tara:strand:+ start:2796 stop:3707 length:912 start_codon:yes stop_codon:yes gene_type:complete
MSRSQLKTLSISQIPTSGTSFTYYNTFSVVQEGSDEASRQVLSIEPMSSPIIEDGQTLITSKNFDLTVSGLFKASTISGLQTLADARTSVVFGGIGLGGQILQAEGAINVNQVFSETASFRFNSPREATGGYNTGTGGDGKHTSELAYSTNGLCLYKWGAAAATGTNALAYGWIKSAGTVSFASANGGVQTFSHSGAATLHRDVHLPFDGVETFHFFIDVTNLTDADDTIKIKIQSFSDYANTENNSAETIITGTGNKLVGILPPSDSKMLRVSIIIGASDSISFRNPSLHTSAVYNFTEFNT